MKYDALTVSLSSFLWNLYFFLPIQILCGKGMRLKHV